MFCPRKLRSTSEQTRSESDRGASSFEQQTRSVFDRGRIDEAVSIIFLA